MSWKGFAAIVVAIGIALVAQAEGVAQTTDESLREKRITISMHRKPLWDVFMRLIDKYDIAIGFEQSNLDPNGLDYRFSINKPDKEINDLPEKDREFLLQSGIHWEGRPRITVEYENERLGTVLDDIVKQMKNYDWEIEGEVVNIFPHNGREPRFAKLMDLHIKKFTAAKGSRIDRIQANLLYRLPELQAFMRENRFRSQVIIDTNTWYPRHPLEEEMNFTDLTFKQLLNGIAKKKRGGWILVRASDGEGDILNLYI